MLHAYLESRKNSVSVQTLGTMKAILTRYGESVIRKDPAELLVAALQAQGIKRYTQVTYLMYLRGYWKFVHHEEAPYGEFMKQNKNLFKNAYERKKVLRTFEEVYVSLQALPESIEREACLRMLLSAQRATEAGLYRKEENRNEQINEETIMGKGSKPRANYSPIATSPTSYYRVYRYLKHHLGLTPHSLRKLAVTRAGDNGATAADLCEIAGWNSIETAFYYLQPKEDKRLKGLLR